MAHNKKLSCKNLIGRGKNLSVDENERSPERTRELLNCYRCGGEGHQGSGLHVKDTGWTS